MKTFSHSTQYLIHLTLLQSENPCNRLYSQDPMPFASSTLDLLKVKLSV